MLTFEQLSSCCKMLTARAILIVDDDEDMRTMLGQIVESFGFETRLAADGNEVLGILESEPIFLILTDIVMSEEDGIQVIAAVRKRHPLIPIIAMTGGGQVAPRIYLKIAEKFGASAVLAKPFSASELWMAMEPLLSPLK